MRTISSRQNPIVATFRAAERCGRSDREHLLLDGIRLIDEAVDARLSITTAVFSHGVLTGTNESIAQLVRRLESSGVDVVSASASVLDAISPTRTPPGAVALARHTPSPIHDVFVSGTTVLALVGVRDPGNVGAIIRASEAGATGGVIVTTGCADPFGWKALRGAMGSSFRLPVSDGLSLSHTVEVARDRGARVLAAVPRGGRSIYDVDFVGREHVVLIGGEASGLAEESVALADERISVPMHPRVESLNTAVAAALILYEGRRQSLVKGLATPSPSIAESTS